MVYFCSFSAAEARFMDDDALGMHENVVGKEYSLRFLED